MRNLYNIYNKQKQFSKQKKKLEGIYDLATNIKKWKTHSEFRAHYFLNLVFLPTTQIIELQFQLTALSLEFWILA